MKKGWIAAVAAVFVVGLGLGAVAGALLFDDDADGAATAPSTTQPELDCEEAQAVVDQSLTNIEEINTNTETQDATFFAAILVEQRTITFTMDAAPTCFPLQDRAGAVGLLDGIRALLDTTAARVTTAVPSTTPSTTPSTPAPADSVAPPVSASTDE